MAEEAFFKSLRGKPLNGLEDKLRSLLREAAEVAVQLLPDGVPLQRWIERRMPGQLKLADGAGRFTLVLMDGKKVVESARLPKPAPSEDGPPEPLTAEETKLRDVLVDVLRSEKGRMPLANVESRREVQMALSRLPPDVSLEDWIKKRVSEEVKHHVDEGSTILTLKQMAKSISVDRWFETLSPDALSDEEVELRAAIYDFLSSWSNPEKMAHVGDLGSNAAIQAAKTACMPKKIPFRDWIERRIGGEIELMHDNGNHQLYVQLTDEGRRVLSDHLREARRREPPPPPPQFGGNGAQRPLPQFAKGPGKGAQAPLFALPAGKQGKGAQAPPLGLPAGRQGKGAQAPLDAPAAAQDVAKVHRRRDNFFASLPADSLTEVELDLRQALLDFLAAWTEDTPPVLGQAGQDPVIKECRDKLPKHVSLASWIFARIGGEIETIEAGNEIFIGLTGSISDEMLDIALARMKDKTQKRGPEPPNEDDPDGPPTKKRRGSRGGKRKGGVDLEEHGSSLNLL
eukprot:gnl/TRDRNA2_/TRDRNA2_140610_c0_seq1.p1 gnl/TRDRNA2_/TRDRNA2_140610_c0~~gnl/TRDRNA2_/TRDRNA2_140610_c0_seq1.p1  ORF type:complete len:513 (+),score=113.18 gnl/TRDRNA2_/TRDRNA2_140610_c0_seq1:102-1640(+)